MLAIGDVHLGTRPSSLPGDLDDFGIDLRTLTPEAALQSAVDRAIAERVDAVLFAGDVVESTNARFEALRPLEAATHRLLDADIAVLGVAGNHDVEALPRLARMIEGFELIGEGGEWQTRVIEKAGKPAAEILGWSFPEKRVRNSPIADLIRRPIPPPSSVMPRIGLLHGDLDASGGNYAPFTSRELSEASLDAWLLGHIHKPSLADGRGPDGAGPRGYLGSLVGLDPGEVGPRGPWLVRVGRSGEIVTQHLAMAPLRWERVDYRVGEDAEPEEIGDQLLEEAERLTRELQQGGPAPLALGLRLRLVGATRHFDALHRYLEAGRWGGARRQVGTTFVFIDKVLDGLDLAHDLNALASGDNPPGLLARKLLILETPCEARSALLEAARSELRGLADEPRWSALQEERDAEDPLSDDALATMLYQAGNAALNELLSQKNVPTGVDQ